MPSEPQDEVNSQIAENEVAANQIVEEIYQNLMGELRLDLELLLQNDPRIRNIIPPP